VTWDYQVQLVTQVPQAQEAKKVYNNNKYKFVIKKEIITFFYFLSYVLGNVGPQGLPGIPGTTVKGEKGLPGNLILMSN